MTELPQRDWRYLQRLADPLIERVSAKMNAEIAAVLARSDLSAREKRVTVYELSRKHHRLVADAFNDWGRRMIWIKLRFLRKTGIMEDADLAGFSEETIEHLKTTLEDGL